MDDDAIAELMRMVQRSIAAVEESLAQLPDERALTRILAHLWSAHDELAFLAKNRERTLQLQAVRS